MFDHDFWLLFFDLPVDIFLKNSRKPENKKEVAIITMLIKSRILTKYNCSLYLTEVTILHNRMHKGAHEYLNLYLMLPSRIPRDLTATWKLVKWHFSLENRLVFFLQISKFLSHGDSTATILRPQGDPTAIYGDYCVCPATGLRLYAVVRTQ